MIYDDQTVGVDAHHFATVILDPGHNIVFPVVDKDRIPVKIVKLVTDTEFNWISTPHILVDVVVEVDRKAVVVWVTNLPLDLERFVGKNVDFSRRNKLKLRRGVWFG